MNTQPQIVTISSKKLIGTSKAMSLAHDATYNLFRSFMPRKKEISNLKDSKVYDIRIFPDDFFEAFNPVNEFTKWAAVEVTAVQNIPDKMSVFELQEGKYAVFKYKGLTPDSTIFLYIFTKWLPTSGFELDHRPHFDILDAKTKIGDPNSEEEIWIPIKEKLTKTSN